VVATIAVGDWNLGPGEVEALGREAGAELAHGRAIDHALFAGLDLVSVRRLGKRGSDHHDVLLFTFALPGGERFRVLCWNVWAGQKPESVQVNLAKLVDEVQPHIIALQEAYRVRRVLGRVTGYRRIQGLLPLPSEDRDCALLVREDLKVLRSGLLRMRSSWISPRTRRPQGARRYPRVRVRTKSGAVVRLLCVHLPFGRKPVAESIERIVAWIKS
jgi:hypothetical protein